MREGGREGGREREVLERDFYRNSITCKHDN